MWPPAGAGCVLAIKAVELLRRKGFRAFRLEDGVADWQARGFSIAVGEELNMKKPIYLDYNATTPHAPEVIADMRPYLEDHFGNPSSSHAYGRAAREAVETARARVAALMGATTDEIIFTSGGTESNNYAIKGAAFARRERGTHLITSAIEHPAVLEVCAWLERSGFDITRLPVDETGRVNPDDLRQAITSRTVLVSVMHANNEVGTIQPIRELADITHAHGALMHTDAAQSVGKIPALVDELGVDLLSVAGHKLYAPKGVGAIYIRCGVSLEKFMHGADHEQGRRASTENVLEIVGLGAACEIARHDREQTRTHLKGVTDLLWENLKAAIPDMRLNGHPTERLPNTLNVGFRRVEAHCLLEAISQDVAASAGSACHSDDISISPVLKAMGTPRDWAGGAIRFSTGKMTTSEEIMVAVEAIARAVKLCRETI